MLKFFAIQYNTQAHSGPIYSNKMSILCIETVLPNSKLLFFPLCLTVGNYAVLTAYFYSLSVLCNADSEAVSLSVVFEIRCHPKE